MFSKNIQIKIENKVENLNKIQNKIENKIENSNKIEKNSEIKKKIKILNPNSNKIINPNPNIPATTATIKNINAHTSQPVNPFLFIFSPKA
jgi:hypothetical protein